MNATQLDKTTQQDAKVDALPRNCDGNAKEVHGWEASWSQTTRKLNGELKERSGDRFEATISSDEFGFPCTSIKICKDGDQWEMKPCWAFSGPSTTIDEAMATRTLEDALRELLEAKARAEKLILALFSNYNMTAVPWVPMAVDPLAPMTVEQDAA